MRLQGVILVANIIKLRLNKQISSNLLRKIAYRSLRQPDVAYVHVVGAFSDVINVVMMYKHSRRNFM